LRDGTVRIRVRAAGVNFLDTLLIAGQYQVKPPLPFTPGAEAAGVISEVGAGVDGFKPGDRVMAMTENGGYAEEIVVAHDRVFRIPDSMDFIAAAGFPIVYGTSHVALVRRAALKTGEWLLVTGAAGGVGLTAIEIGKALGARVIAAAGGPEKLALAQQYGADHGIDYSREDLRQRVREITGWKGADVIYDPVGGDIFDASLRSVAWEGRVLIIGFACGRIPQIPANIALVKNIDIIGFYWGSYHANKPQVPRESFQQLFRWFEEGKLHPHVSECMDLADAPRALQLLQQRKSMGKLVLTC
jgi:NADPH2:quinone reductase